MSKRVFDFSARSPWIRIAGALFLTSSFPQVNCIGVDFHALLAYQPHRQPFRTRQRDVRSRHDRGTRLQAATGLTVRFTIGAEIDQGHPSSAISTAASSMPETK